MTEPEAKRSRREDEELVINGSVKLPVDVHLNEAQELSYFRSYEHLQSHHAMVADEERTNAYRRSLLYQTLYKKTAMDVGCGTGILSIFACQAGARKVYAVDNSCVIRLAKRVVEQNRYSDRVEFFNSRVEQIAKLDEKVDAIISEWMGFTLFSEWMLPSVLTARDRFLKEGGLMFPNKASLFVALATETEYVKNRATYWREMPKDAYKVDMSVLADEEYADLPGKMLVHDVNPDEIISKPVEILSLDLLTLKFSDARHYEADFELQAFGSCDVFGFCIWFSTRFPADVVLDTSPFRISGNAESSSICLQNVEDCTGQTHWHQTMLYVQPFPVKQDDVVRGHFVFRPDTVQSRSLAIHLEYVHVGTGEKRELLYRDEYR